MTDVSLKEARDKAILIAEAPALLEQLIYLRDCAEFGIWPTGLPWERIQALIKKVTGEGT